MKSLVVFPAFLMLCVATAWASPPQATSKGLQAAIAGPQRSPTNVARDKYRHPLQTLEFFGIRPDMRVIEVLPGGGWYTEILAPFLHDHGTLIEATPPVNSGSAFAQRAAMRYAKKLAADPAVYGKVAREPFVLPDYMSLGPPDSADMVLTFRNMHDLIFANVHGVATDTFLRRFFRKAFDVLKPGGILGVEAHRANPDMPVAKSYKLGRLPQAFLISAAEREGFRLGGTSEINANPKDPRTAPVWYFPPSLAASSGNRAQYAAIGEADNMELKFVKPND